MTAQMPHAALLALLREFTVETDRYVEQISSTHGLHRTDMNALAFLVQAGFGHAAVTPGRLGEALNLSSPATTALVDRLDRAGHVTRERSGTDRRQVHLAMTDHARAVGRTLFAPLASHLGAAMEGYTEAELELAQRFLTDMLAATAAARADIPPAPAP
ncbi:MarR family winged helix-turn-helix transcriptional regulator [Arthrobacter sp. 35W]|uniref:MarR family winged helix-turn-helix transcriptional regulator n=1 Tax=Arthrobacter sp. 35W TaxID=1132441 RepID=UPI00040C1F91|nr:MarR family transcriptional regulator [Arthrobacter sp. 35W]